jgi:hypothetical protein
MAHVQFALVSLLIPALLIAGIRTAWVSRFWRDLSRCEAAGLTGCFLLALFARMSARTFANCHTLESAYGSFIGHGERWAAGFSAILHFLYLLFPSNVATAAGLNVIVSALTVLVVFALVDVYFKDRLAAFSAAAVLACQPVSIRYAASDCAHVLLTFCLFAACLFLARWQGEGEDRDLLQGAGWLALAANIRHEGAVYALVGALILAGGTARLSREGLARVCAAGLLYSVFLIYPLSQLLSTLATGKGGGDTVSVFGFLEAFFTSPHSPKSLAVFAVIGAFWAAFARLRPTLAFLLVIVVISLPTSFREFSEMGHRHVLPHLAAWGAFAGLGLSATLHMLSRVLARAGWADNGGQAPGLGRLSPLNAAAVLAVVLWAAAPHRAYLTKMWTYALEYEFITAHLGEIPDHCVMVWPGPDADWQSRGLRLSRDLSWEVGRRHRWISASDQEISDDAVKSCAVFYRATSCFAFESVNPLGRQKDWAGAERPACRQMRDRFDLEPIAATTIPAAPYMCEAYTTNPLPAGFYRLRLKEPRRGPPAPPVK